MTLTDLLDRVRETAERSAIAGAWEHIHISDGNEVIRAARDEWGPPIVGYAQYAADAAHIALMDPDTALAFEAVARAAMQVCATEIGHQCDCGLNKADLLHDDEYEA